LASLESNVGERAAFADFDAPSRSRRYQPMARYVQETSYERFEKKWGPLLGANLATNRIAYQANRIRMIEDLSAGRLAAPIEDAVLRCLIACAVQRDELHILEIGSLFGIGLTVMYDAARGRFKKASLTALDPLSGYYGAGVADTILDIPINQTVFWNNMQVANVPAGAVTLIPYLSTAAEALVIAARDRYDVLVIDGDHSHQGVKFDYDNYLAFVRPGGFVLIDDYGDIWPDVRRFVDDELRSDKRVELVGTDWSTAVFRVLTAGTG
jgi:predicted O-methyltransferase YrrM